MLNYVKSTTTSLLSKYHRFGRAEILAGLANGLFLLFIALFIMKEAIERTFEPPEVHHERLFVISVLGFIVNLIGIFVFQHGGQAHHHHGGGSCSHSHSPAFTKAHSHDHDHQHHQHNHNSHGYSHYESPTLIQDRKQHSISGGVVALDMNGYSSNPPPSYPGVTNNNSLHHHHHQDQSHHAHTHEGIHYDNDPLIEPSTTVNKPKSSGRGQIMQSVFLHIVADTLGSVGVMISALLMNQFGWMIADPLCSLFIAILISVSVYPLLRDSFYVLMQRIPVDLEDKLPDCFQKIQNLTGVMSVYDTHFWTLNSDTYIGCLKLEVTQNADHRNILSIAKTLLNQLGVEKVHIQIDQV